MFKLFKDKSSSASSSASTTSSSNSSVHSAGSSSTSRTGSISMRSSSTNKNTGVLLSKEELESILILNQAECFEVALQAMDYLLDDHADKGYRLLTDKMHLITSKTAVHGGAQHNPPGSEMILTLATGVIQFLEATLGFEASMISKARATMSRAETQAAKAQQYNVQKNLKTSTYYPPGTEFKVTYTESCLLNALLMLFSESMFDSAKALLKLKKAYSNLQELQKLIASAKERQRQERQRGEQEGHEEELEEDDDLEELSRASSADSFRTANESTVESLESDNGEEHANVSKSSIASKSSLYSDVPYDINRTTSSLELLNLAEKVFEMRDQRLKGSHIGNSPASMRLRTELGLNPGKDTLHGDDSLEKEKSTTKTTKTTKTGFLYLNGEESNSKPTVDEFIESGCDLCFGIIQVVLSLLPPAIGGVLSIIGFKGNRENGLRLIWNCVQERNIHGGLGLCALLFYYNGPFQFVDDDFDIPVASESGATAAPASKSAMSSTTSLTSLGSAAQMTKNELLHPGKRLHHQLLKSRAVFPNSALWVFQEGAVLAGNGRLEDAVQVMDSIDLATIEMKQVKTQLVFNRAIMLVHLHQYERAAQDFLYLLEINDWSHAFYTYFAGCCYLENYRMCQLNILPRDKMDYYYERAKTLIYSAPELLHTKKFMAKNLPFDRFMDRKVKLFQQISKKYKIKDPLDCIPVSPINELTYLYDGYTRMDEKNLLLSLRMVQEYSNPAIQLDLESQALIKNFLTAIIYRRIGKVEEGCAIIDREIIPKIILSNTNGKIKYSKLQEDPWLYPSTLYERALFNWKLENVKGLKACKEWLNRSLDYTKDYELSSRIGMKTKAALSRVEDEL